jgi:hypothetical protein
MDPEPGSGMLKLEPVLDMVMILSRSGVRRILIRGVFPKRLAGSATGRQSRLNNKSSRIV